VIAKTALANGTAVENAAKLPGNDTFWRIVRLYPLLSGHLDILVLPHKVLEGITRASFIVGN